MGDNDLENGDGRWSHARLRYPGDDPLEADDASDIAVSTSRRGLTRLAMVACETGARFQREGVGPDPMGWILTPHSLFDGRSALDACLERDACVRALLVHGLGLPIDAGANEAIEESAEGGPSNAQKESGYGRNAFFTSYHHVSGADRASRRLFAATIVGEGQNGTMQAFYATVANRAAEVRTRISARYGSLIAAEADIAEGFDPSLPLSAVLVSEAIADMLLQIVADPTSPLADGLDVWIEQRFSR